MYCLLCCDVIQNRHVLSCGHVFCRPCLLEFRSMECIRLGEDHHHGTVPCPLCHKVSPVIGQGRMEELEDVPILLLDTIKEKNEAHIGNFLALNATEKEQKRRHLLNVATSLDSITSDSEMSLTFIDTDFTSRKEELTRIKSQITDKADSLRQQIHEQEKILLDTVSEHYQRLEQSACKLKTLVNYRKKRVQCLSRLIRRITAETVNGQEFIKYADKVQVIATHESDHNWCSQTSLWEQLKVKFKFKFCAGVDDNNQLSLGELVPVFPKKFRKYNECRQYETAVPELSSATKLAETMNNIDISKESYSNCQNVDSACPRVATKCNDNGIGPAKHKPSGQRYDRVPRGIINCESIHKEFSAAGCSANGGSISTSGRQTFKTGKDALAELLFKSDRSMSSYNRTNCSPVGSSFLSYWEPGRTESECLKLIVAESMGNALTIYPEHNSEISCRLCREDGKGFSPTSVVVLPSEIFSRSAYNEKILAVGDCRESCVHIFKTPNDTFLTPFRKFKDKSASSRTNTTEPPAVFISDRDYLGRLKSTKLDTPVGLCFLDHPVPSLVVTDTVACTVSRIGLDNSFIWSVNLRDDRFKLEQPKFITYDHIKKRLLITDSRTNQIISLDTDGKLLGRFQLQSNAMKFSVSPKPYGICVTRSGNLVIADGVNRDVGLYSSDGRSICSVINESNRLWFPYGLSLSSDDQKLCVTSKDGFVNLYKTSSGFS